MLENIHKWLTIGLVCISGLCLVNGLYHVICTSGTVYGTEFGMQVRIVNLLAKLMLFAGTYFIWTYISGLVQKQKSETSC